MAAIILPFVLLVWWLVARALGKPSTAPQGNGLNMRLPGAVALKDSAKDKLAFYLSAQADSAKRMEQVRNDPYMQDTVKRYEPIVYEKPAKHYTPVYTDVQKRADDIQRRYAVTESKVIEPLEKKIPEKPDPEIAALNETLDKLIAIQHPEKQPTINKQEYGYSVNAGGQDDETLFGNFSGGGKASFYGDKSTAHFDNSFLARVAATQILQSGSVVKLELVSAITINNKKIAAGSAIYGVAVLQGERLQMHISSVKIGNSILPVSLIVFDMDGMEGIYVPGSLSREVAKESAEQFIQSTGVSGFDISLKTQAVGAGIGAAKSLLTKKVKAARVTVSAGYEVLLVDKNQK